MVRHTTRPYIIAVVMMIYLFVGLGWTCKAQGGEFEGVLLATTSFPPIGIDPSDPHKFYYNGETFFPIGIYPQIAAITNGDTHEKYDYISFLNTLQSHGVNYFRSQFAMGPDRRISWPKGQYTLTPWQRTGPGLTNDGGLKYDLYRYNEANFQQWEDILREADNRDIVAQMTIFDCWSIKERDHYGWGWDYNPFNGVNNVNGIDATDNNGVGNRGFTDLSRTDVIEAQKALIREVVDRYSPVYGNLVYEIANENYYSREWELHLADYLTEYEQSKGYPRHLVMPRDLPNHDFDIGSNPFGERIKTYDPHEINDGMEALWVLGQPLISDSDGLVVDISADEFSRWYWACFTSGGYADKLHSALTGSPNGASIPVHLDRLAYLRDFVSQTDYAQLIPADQLVASGDAFLLRNPGSEYIAYASSGGTFTLNLTEVGLGESLVARWFDPRSGVFSSEFQVQSGNINFNTPDSNDWVLHIRNEIPTFVDVPFDHAYHDEIETLYQNGYVAGCSTDPLMYCPERIMNRAESSVFVERGIHGAQHMPGEPMEQIFADVALGEWYAKWSTALWEDGYTAGCGTNPLVYCPMQGHTRAEGAVFYLRMLKGVAYEPPAAQGIFSDVALGEWYAKWVEAAYQEGLIEACQTTPDLRYCPEDPLTRAVAAYMMVQAKGLLP